MIAEIITIGDEILIGQIVDTNSAWMGVEFNRIGIKINRIVSVSDSESEILAAFAESLSRADLVLVTGGLGPTKDDITKHCLCTFFSTYLETDHEVEDRMRVYFESRGRVMSEANRSQADIPKACTVIMNELGTASGMWFEQNGKVLVSMPGVPYEMKRMVSKYLIPKIEAHFERPQIFHQTIMTAGMVESKLAETIADLEDALPNHIKLAYLPRPGIVRLRLSGFGDDAVSLQKQVLHHANKIAERVKAHHYGWNDASITTEIGKLLIAKGAMMATAESCTGGFIAHLITSESGSSQYFEGGIVSYSNQMKASQLQTSPETIEKFGAVSEQVVLEMVAGLKSNLKVAYGIAVSGIAGPLGGTPEKPVGTVCIAVSGPQETIAKTFNFGNERSLNIERAAMHALYLLWKMLAEK